MTSKRPSQLSATFVKTIKNPGRYGEGRGGHGLTLLVKDAANGRVSKSWCQRLRLEGRPFDIGLGAYPIVTLAEAREKALQNARAVARGEDVRIRAEAPLTLEKAAERAIEILRPTWKASSKTEAQMRGLLETYAYPHIGNKRIDAVRPVDVLDFLAPLALEKPATAKKLKSYLSQIFKWAVSTGLMSGNPADSNISSALPKLTAKEHRQALSHADVAGALATVRQSGAWIGTRLAFEFLVLTAARSGDVRLATWNEVDLEARTWTIPAGHMKAGREHRVPLSGPALAVLKHAQALGPADGLIFPSATGKAASDSTLSKLLRENGIGAVPHGFRSSFRDWAADSGYEREVAEEALAHAVQSASEAAYRRSDLLERRRDMMSKWAAYIGAGS